MRGQAKTIRLTADLTDAQAWNLAQFLKRVGFSEFRNNAQDEQEAYAMRDAAQIVRKALAEEGYAPR
jgi:dissimilatory sulfite reductase (desulfoviridin) alpha/beta subunit